MDNWCDFTAKYLPQLGTEWSVHSIVLLFNNQTVKLIATENTHVFRTLHRIFHKAFWDSEETSSYTDAVLYNIYTVNVSEGTFSGFSCNKAALIRLLKGLSVYLSTVWPSLSLLCSRGGSERTLFRWASCQGLLLQSRQVSSFGPGRAGLTSPPSTAIHPLPTCT